MISGSSKVSKKETYWISKATFLIRKFARSFEAPEGGRPEMPEMPEMTDRQLEEIGKSTGHPLTDETKAKIKKTLQEVKARMKTNDLKGASTETHAKVETPKLTQEDLNFQVPAGTVLNESFFGGAFDRK